VVNGRCLLHPQGISSLSVGNKTIKSFLVINSEDQGNDQRDTDDSLQDQENIELVQLLVCNTQTMLPSQSVTRPLLASSDI